MLINSSASVHIHASHTQRRCAGLQKFVDRYNRGQQRRAGTQKKEEPAKTGSPITIRGDKLDGSDLIYIGNGQYVRVRCTRALM